MNDLEEVKEDIKEIKSDVKKLMIFMAVSKATEQRRNKINSAYVAVIVSVASSGIIAIATHYFGG